MKLRGHHLFCTALFSGHGYDEPFTERMESVIDRLEAGESFRLLIGADEICATCPNRREEGGCALGTADVRRRDEAALRVLGLSEGQEITWAQVKPLLSEITEEEFQRVCGDCRWQREGLCSSRLLRERCGV